MPRYCAVKVCRNRGGTASRQDNRRISFYPFPLQDKTRLQKWVDNMKREEWTPSRHQYLCSEHFTEDCFDIRWGIRYLKNTAIPTIFPSAEDDGEKKVSTIKRSVKAKPKISDIDTEHKGFESPLSKRPLILSRTCKKSSMTNPEMTFESHLVSDTGDNRTIVDDGLPSVSCLALPQCVEPQSEDQRDSVVTVLCCETLDSFCKDDTKVDAAALQAALGQALSIVPVEIIEEEPLEEGGPDEGEHISVYEHSYSRPDTDKDQLWSKILGLHAKIMELERREESTMSKVRALEAEISVLKRDGALFKEKQKVLEDYISSAVL